MAGVKIHAPTGEIALTAATLKTVAQLLTAANHRVIIKGYEVHGKGVLSTDTPMRVRLLRQTTAGTMSAGTAVKNDNTDSEAIQTTFTINATVEPTAGDILDVLEVHPQSGQVVMYPPGDEIQVPGGTRFGADILAAQGQTITFKFFFEE
jgi:hypothetical protein